MINREGFVYITPQGSYVKRTHPLGHGNPAKTVFIESPTLDGATIFPGPKPPNNSVLQDYSNITGGRDNLQALKAVSSHRVRLNP